MTVEEIKQELIEQGKDPNDFNIEITKNGYSVTPKWFYEQKTIAKREDTKLKQGIDISTAQSTAKTIELLATLNEQQKIEQAQASAELIELMLSLQGGM